MCVYKRGHALGDLVFAVQPRLRAVGISLAIAAYALIARPAQAQQADLVAAYSFDEGAGTLAGDSSGNPIRDGRRCDVASERPVWQCVEL
jgi:hypothetical protein